MAPRLVDPAGSGLKTRVLTALALGPLTLVVVYLGNPYVEIELAVLAAAMAWEWARMCNGGRFGADGWVSVAAVIAAMIAATLLRFDLALYILAIGAIVVGITAAVSGNRAVPYAVAAPIAIGLACVALGWIRSAPQVGLSAFLWLLLAVWSTDIGAYFVGRRIGGPRLAPRISPKKTWAGLVGGAVCAALLGVLWGFIPGASDGWILGGLGAIAALTAQCGDLAVSLVKRRFGAKDASGLVPGHGGVLDRFDGFLLSSPLLAAFVWITKGKVWPPL